MSNFKNIARFVRTTWLPAALLIISTFILYFLGYAGDIAISAWQRGQRGAPLAGLSKWLAINYGDNHQNLLLTHFCFCWAFALLFVASTFAPLPELRRRFFTGFVLGWSLIVAFWSFLAACVALPYYYLITILPEQPAIIPKLVEPLFWGLPALCIVLLAWRLIRLFRARRRISSSSPN